MGRLGLAALAAAAAEEDILPAASEFEGEDKGGMRCVECGVVVLLDASKEDDSRSGRADAAPEADGGGGSQDGEVDELTDMRDAVGEMP